MGNDGATDQVLTVEMSIRRGFVYYADPDRVTTDLGVDSDRDNTMTSNDRRGALRSSSSELGRPGSSSGSRSGSRSDSKRLTAATLTQADQMPRTAHYTEYLGLKRMQEYRAANMAARHPLMESPQTAPVATADQPDRMPDNWSEIERHEEDQAQPQTPDEPGSDTGEGLARRTRGEPFVISSSFAQKILAQTRAFEDGPFENGTPVKVAA